MTNTESERHGSVPGHQARPWYYAETSGANNSLAEIRHPERFKNTAFKTSQISCFTANVPFPSVGRAGEILWLEQGEQVRETGRRNRKVPSPRWGSGKPGAPGEPDGSRGVMAEQPSHEVLSVSQDSFVGLRVLALLTPGVAFLR